MNRFVPEPRMEGGCPRPPHADARLMDALAACFSLKPCSCGGRGRAPSMGLNGQHKFWNKSNIFKMGCVALIFFGALIFLSSCTTLKSQKFVNDDDIIWPLSSFLLNDLNNLIKLNEEIIKMKQVMVFIYSESEIKHAILNGYSKIINLESFKEHNFFLQNSINLELRIKEAELKSLKQLLTGEY